MEGIKKWTQVNVLVRKTFIMCKMGKKIIFGHRINTFVYMSLLVFSEILPDKTLKRVPE